MPAAELIENAFQQWAAGDQSGAVETVRAGAEANDPVCLALICWFLAQRGEPYWREGVSYLERSLRNGYPWALNYYLGNMQNDAGLRQRVPELMALAIRAGNFQFDPLQQGYAFWNQDRPTGVRTVEIIGGPPPQPEGWDDFLTRVSADYSELTLSAEAISQRRSEALAQIDNDLGQVTQRRTDVETRTQQLLTLIDQTTNAQVQTFFDTEATKYEGEGRFLWRWSVGLLIAAALFAVAPLVIYYAGTASGHHWLTHQNLIAAHFAPAVALGAVAGVLLARARGRDRARQRARDLSVALGTMFVYSGQIADENERQLFLRDMGRTVIEAFLRQDSPVTDGDGAGGLLSALVRRG